MNTPADIVKPLVLSQGLFFVVEFSARGGTTYRRVGETHEEIREDESKREDYSTRKEVDHIGLAKWSRQIVNSAYHVMEKYCSPTPIGYWIAEANKGKLLEEIARIREEASKMNKYSREAKSARRVTIDIYAMEVGSEDLEKTAKRLAQTVRERLESLRDDLQNGDLNAYATSWKRAKNLPRLATGIQAESIVMALEAARELRSKLAAALKAKAQPEADAGKALDLTPIESAIFLFTDSVNGTLAEVNDPDVEEIR